jgi:cell division protein FtsN
MAQATMRQRGRGAPTAGKWLALMGVVVIALVLTFAVGVLVGRQWVRHPLAMQASSDPVRKPAASRRSGLTEPLLERPAQQEKLTFYQTLTAPLGPPPPPSPPSSAKHDPPVRPVPSSAVAGPGSAEHGPIGVPGTAARPDRSAPDHPAPSPAVPRPERSGPERAAARSAAAETRADWVVQVGAFRDRNQAETVRRPLAAAGFDAYVLAVPEGTAIRYKVRLGGFKSRDDAARMAERVKQERSLAAFVTSR